MDRRRDSGFLSPDADPGRICLSPFDRHKPHPVAPTQSKALKLFHERPQQWWSVKGK